jgi:DNA-binding IclR family transcriptional regulator
VLSHGCLRCCVSWVIAVEGGERVTQLAQHIGLSQPTTHRLLRSLMDEGMVEQDARSKRYRLSLDFFALAARAGNSGNLRELVRPSLLRLSASLGDSLFLLARSGFDAVCLDRSEGPFPIRTFTGDIGGRVALGVGQGSLAILAFLPEEERDTVIHYNLPRLKDFHLYDEVFLRSEIENVRKLGYAGAQHRRVAGHGRGGGADSGSRRAGRCGVECGHRE